MLAIKNGLLEGTHYVIVSETVWRILHDRYGGGPAIARPVWLVGHKPQVEVYPLDLKVIRSSTKSMVNVLISKEARITDLRKLVCTKLGIANEEDTRLWDFFSNDRHRLLVGDAALRTFDIQRGQKILLEEKEADGSWVFEEPDLHPTASMSATHAPTATPLANGGGITASTGATHGHNGGASGLAPRGHTLVNSGDAYASAKPLFAHSLSGNHHYTGSASNLSITSPSSPPIDDEPTDIIISGDVDDIAGSPPTAPAVLHLPYDPSQSIAAGPSFPTSAEASSGRPGPSPLAPLHQPLNRPSQTGLARHAKPLALSASSPSLDTDAAVVDRSRRGIAGLNNLGNTCFMNSSLQCLCHTAALVSYFCDPGAAPEINRTNPLGMQGQVADAFGELTRSLWDGRHSAVAPRQFKATLAQFAPQFSGYNQHDSQELLAFLLDGLHEDLNRVLNKPYVEAKEAAGRPDIVVAEEGWANHKARNDSVIVDTFLGQFKSTLVCPSCGKTSVTFDPFMYLSLPLPVTSERTLYITVVTMDGSAPPTKYGVRVPKHGQVADLLAAVSRVCGLRADENLLVAEIFNHRIYRFYDNASEGLSTIQADDELYAYRMPKTLQLSARDAAAAAAAAAATAAGSSTSSPVPAGNTQSLAVPTSDAGVPSQGEPNGSHAEGGSPAGNGPHAGDAPSLSASSATPAVPSVPAAPTHGQGGGAGKHRTKDIVMLHRNEAMGLAIGVPTLCSYDSLGPHATGADLYELVSRAASPFLRQPTTTGGMGDVMGATGGAARGGGDGDDENGVAGREDTPAGPDGGNRMDTGEDGGREGRVSGEDATDRMSVDGGWGEHAEGPAGSTNNVGTRGVGNAGGGGDGDEAQGPLFTLRVTNTTGTDEGPVITMDKPLRELVAARASALEASSHVYHSSTRLRPASDCLYIMVVWHKPALALYDVSRLDKPREHTSVAATRNSREAEPAFSLYACVEAFLKEEPLGKDDMWYCPQCKDHRQASKKFDLWKLPDCLIVHLKRFSYSRWNRDKLENLVDFPISNLDLSRYVVGPCEQPPVYDLYAVSNHYGGLGGGHYTAEAKHHEDGRWYSFDDSHVSPTSEDKIKTNAAYLLFYQRRGAGGAGAADGPGAERDSPGMKSLGGDVDMEDGNL
eukprot:jgi/Mesvir1/3725/Mv15003-RA.2